MLRLNFLVQRYVYFLKKTNKFIFFRYIYIKIYRLYMKKTIRITESELHDMIRNSVKNILTEANRIRRVRDDEYPESQIDLDDLSALKDNNYTAYKSLIKNLDKPLNHNKTKKIQQDLTKKLQDRLVKQGKSIYADPKTIDISNTALRKLESNGIKLEIKGETFSYGNTKLPPSTMIINLTSAFNCPSKHCPLRKGVCYARKNENQWGVPELRNLRNEFALEQLTVKEILQLLDTYIMNSSVRIKQIRLSENGDFKSQEVVDFCEKMARHLEAKYGIRTTCYTHQPFDFTNCKSMIVNSSMPGEKIAGADRNYIAISPEAFEKTVKDGLTYDSKRKQMTFKCYCDCHKCNFCYNTKEENGEDPNMRTTVYCAIH